MGEVIDLREARLRQIAGFAFKGWGRKFKETFSHNTTISTVGSEVIKFFAFGTPQSMQILQVFVAKCRYPREIQQFGNCECLDTSAKREIIDISLFLLDQIRFEAMFRLGWVDHFSARSIPMVELAIDFYNEYEWLQYEVPPLNPNHPLFSDYTDTYETDRSSFVRRLIPNVLEVLSHLPPTSFTNNDSNNFIDR